LALGEPDFEYQDVSKLPGVIADTAEAALLTEIKISKEWADSRGHYEVQKRDQAPTCDIGDDLAEFDPPKEVVDWRADYEAQRRQRVAGSYMRVSSAAEEIEHSDAFIGESEFVRSRHGLFAVPREALAAIGMPQVPRVLYAVSEGASADPLTTIGNYNLVEFDGTFYGIPQGLPVDWNDLATLEPDAVFKCASAKELVERVSQVTARRIDDRVHVRTQRSFGPAAVISHLPRLLKSVGNYNLVSFEGWIYGIPQSLGPIDLEQVDVMEWPEVIRDVSEDVVESEILARSNTQALGIAMLAS
jgi:hypothetical protein